MDNGITLIAIVVAAATAGVIVWYGLRRNLPPEVAEQLAEAAAQVREMLGGVVTEQDVRAVATFIYRSFATGSKYISEEQFVDLVTRAVLRANANQAELRSQAAAAGVLAQ